MRTNSLHRRFFRAVLFAAIFHDAACLHATDVAAIAEKWSGSVMLVNNTTTSREQHLGTAFVVESSGLLVTNFHVIQNAESITIKSANGGEFRGAKVLATDKTHDLAVLSIEAKNLPAVRLAGDGSTKIGSDVVVIGNPKGLEQTVTEGIVSATRKVEGRDVIQISAPISSGSSGSPVFSAEGEVIGVATFKVVDGEALNFAMPSEHVKSLIELATSNPGASPEISSKDSIFTQSGVDPESKKQDTEFSSTQLFKDIKSHEKNAEYFPMLSRAKEAVEQFPKSALAHRVLSDAFYYAKLNDEALDHAIVAIKLDPENTRGWNNLAILFKEIGDDEMVKKVYGHAIKIAPNDAKLLIEYADLIKEESPALAYSGLMHAKTVILDRSGVDLETETYNLERQTIEVLSRMNRNEDAFTVAKAFKDNQPDNAQHWLTYAYAAAASGQLSEVQPALVEANRRDSTLQNRPELFAFLGDIKVLEDDFNSAISFYYKALSVDPNHLEALEGVVYARIDEAYKIGRLEDRVRTEMLSNIQKINAVDTKLAKEILDDVSEELAESGIRFP